MIVISILPALRVEIQKNQQVRISNYIQSTKHLTFPKTQNNPVNSIITILMTWFSRRM